MNEPKAKNCNMILTEIQQKNQHYHQVKVINTNASLANIYCVVIKV